MLTLLPSISKTLALDLCGKMTWRVLTCVQSAVFCGCLLCHTYFNASALCINCDWLRLQAASSTSASGGCRWRGCWRRLCATASCSGCPCCWTASSPATSTANPPAPPWVTPLRHFTTSLYTVEQLSAFFGQRRLSASRYGECETHNREIFHAMLVVR